MTDDYHYPNSVASLPVIPKTPAEAAAGDPPATAPERTPDVAQTPEALPARMPAATEDPTGFVRRKLIEGKVIEALRGIFDPEIPVNIHELGLIYDIAVSDENDVHIRMTLTAPACPVAGSLPGEVEQKVNAVEEVRNATVELVWDPPWSRDRMSEAAQLQLGLL